MEFNSVTLISIAGALVSALTWFETRRMRQFAKYGLQAQSYGEAASRPILNAVGTVRVKNKTRVKLIIFNQRETALKLHCVRSYVYAPKPRNFPNWLRSRFSRFDWNFSPVDSVWNPKGTLDDEHFAEETLPFTRVREHEFILLSMMNFGKIAATDLK